MKNFLYIGLALGSITVHASTFQGSTSGRFINPVGPATMVASGEGTDSFTWGESLLLGGDPSSLNYTGISFDINEDDPFVLGSLTFFNGNVLENSVAENIDLTMDFDFSTPLGTVESFSYSLGLINTENTSDPAVSADAVNFNNSVASSFFSYSGIDYTVEFLGFGQLIGSGFSVDNSFHVLEDSTATVDLIGRITSNPTIPEPSVFALLGIGFAGIRLLRNNKS